MYLMTERQTIQNIENNEPKNGTNHNRVRRYDSGSNEDTWNQ